MSLAHLGHAILLILFSLSLSLFLGPRWGWARRLIGDGRSLLASDRAWRISTKSTEDEVRSDFFWRIFFKKKKIQTPFVRLFDAIDLARLSLVHSLQERKRIEIAMESNRREHVAKKKTPSFRNDGQNLLDLAQTSHNKEPIERESHLSVSMANKDNAIENQRQTRQTTAKENQQNQAKRKTDRPSFSWCRKSIQKERKRNEKET